MGATGGVVLPKRRAGVELVGMSGKNPMVEESNPGEWMRSASEVIESKPSAGESSSLRTGLWLLSESDNDEEDEESFSCCCCCWLRNPAC